MIQSTYMESENSGRTKVMSKASLVAPMVKNLSAAQETWVQSLGWQIPWKREGQPAPVFLPGEFHDMEFWGAAVCGVAQSQAQLKRLGSSRSRVANTHTE